MGFLSSLVFGFCTGLSFVGWISWLQKKRSEVRLERAKDIASLSRLDREDLKKLITPELMPSWCNFQTSEKVEWLNRELKEIWPFVSEAASEMIQNSVQPILDSNKPVFLSKFEFSKLTLGTRPPQIGGIQFMNSSAEEVVMVVDFKWGGDPNIVLRICTVAGVAVQVQLKDFMLFGFIKLIFRPLVDDFPCFGAVTVSFTSKPRVEFVLKVAGGDISSVSWLESPIKRVIQQILEAQLVWPARIVVPIKPGDYEDLMMKDVGVLDIKLVQANDLSNTDMFGKSDPFVELYVRPIPDLICKSKTKSNQLNPVWNQGFEIKVQDPTTQTLVVRVWDEESVGPAELIGEASYALKHFLQNPGILEDVMLTLSEDCEHPKAGDPKGKVHLEIVYRPYGPDGIPMAPPILSRSLSITEVNKPTELDTMLGLVHTTGRALKNGSLSSMKPSFNRGVLFVTVEKATNLLAMDITGTSDPYVTLWMRNGQDTKERTQVIYKELNPIWNEQFEFLVENPNDDMIMIEVYDHDMFGRRDFLGRISLTLTRVMYLGQYRDEFPLVGVKQGSLTLSLKWSPIPI